MKKFAGFLAVLLLFSGCMQKVQLNDRSIIQAIGIDPSGDGGYTVTMQVAEATREPAAANQADGKEEFHILVEEGDSLTNIFSEAAIRQGRQLFLGSCKLVVIGEDTAIEGIDAIVGFFNTHHQINPSLKCIVAQGSAGELLRAKEKNPILTADGILDMLRSAYNTGTATSSRLMDVVGALHGDNMVGALAVVRLQKAEPSASSEETDGQQKQSSSQREKTGGTSAQEKPTLELVGTALFAGERLDTIIDTKATRGLAWTQNSMTSAALSVEDGQLGRVSAVVHAQSARISPELVGDHMVFNIAVKVHSAMQEIDLIEADVLDEQSRDYAAILQKRKIHKEIEYMVQQTQKQGYDLLGLSLLTRQRYPDFYEAYREEWSDVIRNAGYSITVDCLIDRSGVGEHTV